jgi:predicted chitinase
VDNAEYTLSRLKKFAPKGKPELLGAVARGAADLQRAGITTPLRFQHFMAQLAHESGGFTSLSENLNYTSAARIRAVWPTRFKTNKAAQPFVRKPRDLANKVYNGRLGNRAGSDDGWIYRGGGFMQTTGRANYAEKGELTGFSLEEKPELLRDPDTAFVVACKEWEVRKCNEAADRDDVAGVTRKINGGLTGLADREEWLQRAKEIFKDTSKPKVVSGGLADKMSRDQVRRVQLLLDDAGYHEVGAIDGLWGPRTRGALSSLQLDNDLPDTNGMLDERTLAFLPLAPQRPVDTARATATSAVVAVNAPGVIASSLAGRFRAKVGALGSGVVAVVLGAFSYLREGYEYVEDIRESIPVWAWIALLGAVCTYFWYNNARGVKGAVESYRAGKVV